MLQVLEPVRPEGPPENHHYCTIDECGSLYYYYYYYYYYYQSCELFANLSKKIFLLEPRGFLSHERARGEETKREGTSECTVRSFERADPIMRPEVL